MLLAFEGGSPSYTSMNNIQIISMLGHTDLQNQQCCYSRSNKIEVCENELAKCFWQSRWLDHQLGWVGLPTFLAPHYYSSCCWTQSTQNECISPSNKLKMYVISLAIQPLAGGRVWDFFFNMKKIESKHLPPLLLLRFPLQAKQLCILYWNKSLLSL